MRNYRNWLVRCEYEKKFILLIGLIGIMQGIGDVAHLITIWIILNNLT